MNRPTFNINDAIDEAARLAKQGEHAQAIRLYDQVLAAAPGNKRAKKGLKALRSQGNALSPADFARVGRLMESGKTQEAVVELRKLCRANPGQPALFNTLGVALSQAGDRSAALEAFKKAYEMQPDFWEALNNLASTYTALERYQEALPHFQTLVTEGNADAEVYTNLAKALRGAKQHEDALQALRHALQLAPLSVDAHNSMGNILNEIGRHEDALGAYNSALAMQPRYITALLNKARTLVDLERGEEAATTYETVLRLEPKNQAALRGRTAL